MNLIGKSSIGCAFAFISALCSAANLCGLESHPLAPTQTVPMISFVLHKNVTVPINYSFTSQQGTHPGIICYDNTLQPIAQIAWQRNNVCGGIRTLPLILQTSGPLQTQAVLADASGTIDIYNNTNFDIIINCGYTT